jgi:hypothetical protein
MSAYGRRNPMRIKALIILLAIIIMPSLVQAQTGCGVPSAGSDRWPVATPESVGLSSAALCPMAKWLGDSKQDNVHAVIVVRHGKLVFERYFKGNDEHLGRPAGEVAFTSDTRRPWCLSIHSPRKEKISLTTRTSWRSSELWPAETAGSQKVAKSMVSSFVSGGWRTRLATRVCCQNVVNGLLSTN